MRQPSIGRLIAFLTGATVVLLLAIDSTMACRFFVRYRSCPPPVAVGHVASPVYYGEVVYGDVSGSYPCGEAIESCCVGEVVTGGYVTEGHVIQSTPTPAVAPQVDTAEDVSETPPSTASPAPMPNDVEAAPSRVEPAVVEEPADDLPADDLPTDDLPTDDLPADDLPADDVFPPADEPAVDDLFDEPPADAPADQPADDLFDEPTPADDSVDDLFNETAPNDDLDVFEQPANDASPDASDNLIENPAEGTSGAPADGTEQPLPPDGGTELPGFDDAPPADQPTDAPPGDSDADSLDDLFGAGVTADPEPRTAVREGESTGATGGGDLFDELNAPAEAGPTTDDLFAPPVETPSTPSPAQENDSTVDDLDDLFGAAPAPSLAEPPAVTKPVADSTVELPVRVWTDNTGRYQTVGRLMKVSPTHVKLLKENGRLSTVPKHRLSTADLTYVLEMTKQLGIERFEQVARR